VNARFTGEDIERTDDTLVPEPSVSRGGCPVVAFQTLINGKYKLRIVWDLKDGPLRYSEIGVGLLRGMVGTPQIAPRVLSRELKALTQSGLIARKDYGLMPPKVDYRLTAKGRSFVPVIAAIRKWGHAHLDWEPTAKSTAGKGVKRASRKR
jgi:DNA-binding HxlR family transcriptional regulator